MSALDLILDVEDFSENYTENKFSDAVDTISTSSDLAESIVDSESVDHDKSERKKDTAMIKAMASTAGFVLAGVLLDNSGFGLSANELQGVAMVIASIPLATTIVRQPKESLSLVCHPFKTSSIAFTGFSNWAKSWIDVASGKASAKEIESFLEKREERAEQFHFKLKDLKKNKISDYFSNGSELATTLITSTFVASLSFIEVLNALNNVHPAAGAMAGLAMAGAANMAGMAKGLSTVFDHSITKIVSAEAGNLMAHGAVKIGRISSKFRERSESIKKAIEKQNEIVIHLDNLADLKCIAGVPNSYTFKEKSYDHRTKNPEIMYDDDFIESKVNVNDVLEKIDHNDQLISFC